MTAHLPAAYPPMDTAIESAPSIIEAAAQSTLGILALLILTVGVIAYLFFGKSSDRVKVVIFSMIFVGMAGFGLVVLGESTEARTSQVERRDEPPPVREGEEAPLDGGVEPPRRDPAGPDPESSRTPPSDRTEITLTYAGDMYGCVLDLEVTIGDRHFVPQSNMLRADDVSEGRQPYEVAGIISCPDLGTCEAYGSGTLDVAPNAVYGLSWQNEAVGACAVVLHRGP